MRSKRADHRPHTVSGYAENLKIDLALDGQGSSLYRHMGFRPIARYRDNPVEGAVYLELELASP